MSNNEKNKISYKEKIKISYMVAVIIAIAAIVIICFVSVIFGIVSLDALPANYIGAALGSLIGALITLVLLRGQTDIEEKKGKDIKILEKKTEVFQNYIKDVWKVWKDQKITIEEFQELTSKYYQNLMIYLKKDRLDKIGNELSKMGKKIGKSAPEDINELRGSIIATINELSDELELGGHVNEDIMKDHDKIVFPLVFKNQILEEADKVLPIDVFEKSKFEDFKEGKVSRECLCFYFKKFKGCRIVIDGFNGAPELVFFLVVDTNYHEFDGFRATGKEYRQRIDMQHNLLEHVEGDEDKESSRPINFYDEKISMEFYRTQKRDFPKVLAKRIKYHFYESKIKVEEEDLGLLEFLEKFYEGQPEK